MRVLFALLGAALGLVAADLMFDGWFARFAGSAVFISLGVGLGAAFGAGLARNQPSE